MSTGQATNRETFIQEILLNTVGTVRVCAFEAQTALPTQLSETGIPSLAVAGKNKQSPLPQLPLKGSALTGRDWLPAVIICPPLSLVEALFQINKKPVRSWLPPPAPPLTSVVEALPQVQKTENSGLTILAQSACRVEVPHRERQAQRLPYPTAPGPDLKHTASLERSEPLPYPQLQRGGADVLLRGGVGLKKREISSSP